MKSKKKITKNTNLTLSASAAALWEKCPGALLMGQNVFKNKSEADDGNLVHAMAALELSKINKNFNLGVKVKKSLLFQVEKAKTRSDYAELQEMVAYYLQSLKIELAYLPKSSLVEIETPLIHSYKGVKIIGVPDLLLINHEAKEIVAIDLKTGYVSVDSENNSQLLLLTHLAAIKYKLSGYSYKLIIIQPRTRNYSSSSGVINPNYLPSLVDAVKEKIALLKDKYTNYELALRAGNHCTYCPAASYCPEFEKQFKKMVTPEFLGQVHNSVDVWLDVLEYEKVLTNMIEDSKRALKAYHDLGGVINHDGVKFNKVTRNIRRAWVSDIDPKAFAKRLKLPLKAVMDEKLKSPTQITKLKLTPKQQELVDEHMSMITSTKFERSE